MKNSQLNYKNKYLELRSKYINDLDMAFRLGVEQGMQQAQQQQALDAQQQANELEMAQTQGMSNGMGDEPGQPQEPGAEGQESGVNNPQSPGIENQSGSELDQHINKLEGMLGKDTNPEVQKSLNEIKSLRKAEKFAIEMKKSEKTITGIAKALHKPAFKIGVQATNNLTDSAKKAVTLQHKIVDDIMKAWDGEKNKAEKDITKILNIEGLLKE